MSGLSIKHVTVDEIRRMDGMEGLVLQGCGGNPARWVAAINELFLNEGILPQGGAFHDIYVFGHGGLPNILFNMEDVELDVGKLAMWRIASHDTFGGTWLSDYRENQLGVRLGNIEVAPALGAASAMDSEVKELSVPPAPAMAPAGEKEAAGQRLVYVCAPLRGEVERNVEAARLFAKEIFTQGDIPICPHLLFSPIADPKTPAEDAKALAMCMKLIETCHVVNVYGQPTEGMQAEIEHTKRMGIPVHEVAPAKKKAKGKGSRGPSR